MDGPDPCDPRRVYPLYVRREVVDGFLVHCARCTPDETVGALFGFRRSWNGVRYTFVAHWEPGEERHTNTAYARLDAAELSAIRNRVDAAGGRDVLGDFLGICHSHPFGVATELSHTDHQTFLSFPYNYPGNAFLLTDPTIGMVRWYVIATDPSGTEATADLRSCEPVSHDRDSLGLIETGWVAVDSRGKVGVAAEEGE